MQPIKVLVVDDSALMRKLIPQIISQDPMLEVVGTAMDGEFALKKIAELKPDVVTLDLDMPRMDGMETLRQIMRGNKVPVIIVSSLSTEGASATFKALGLGATDFVTKPKDALLAQMEEISLDLIFKIKAASQRRDTPDIGHLDFNVKVNKPKVHRLPANNVVAIGISTGGPNSLQLVLSQLPSNFPFSIVIVQHMPEGFTELFAKRLDDCCAIDVKEAEEGDTLLAGRALICPGNRHIIVHRTTLGGEVSLNEDARVNGHRPSADVLFHSVAEAYGDDAIGVIMTGMGEDGADGLGEMRRAGAYTVAQDEATSVVFGMPRAAIERGYVQRVVPLCDMASVLQNYATYSPKRAGKL